MTGKNTRYNKNLLSFIDVLKLIFELFFLPFALMCSLFSRFVIKKIDIGIGPDFLINNIHHKKALQLYGYKVETFVHGVSFITDEFDLRADKALPFPFLKPLRHFYLFLIVLLRYRGIYFYFTGGPLGYTALLWRLEPLFYQLAGIKTVVMPFGHDVQDFSRSGNLLFKHANCQDYPNFRFGRNKISKLIDIWSKYADHVISGCEWVDYMYHWDTLMLAHFSIDTDLWKSKIEEKSNPLHPFKILHAPNHKIIKGTDFFVKAVEELQKEGLDVELVLLEGVPNSKIKNIMTSVDIVADQLIVGWYAMFAIEAMSLEKPVLCYLREDLIALFESAGIISQGEIPVINCSPQTVKETIRNLIKNREQLTRIGKQSREFVVKHHSIESVGKIFDDINKKIRVHF